MQLGDKIPKFTKNGKIELGSVYFGCKKYSKNILYHDECQVGRKTQSNGKSFLLTVKYQPLRCKINYTSNLPSNHLHSFFTSIRTKRERERRKNNTYNGARREHKPPEKGLDHCVNPMNEL